MMRKPSPCMSNSREDAIMNRFVVAIVSALIVSATASRLWAEEPLAILLWDNGAPGAKGDTQNDKPKLLLFRPPQGKSVGTGIIICPGGGYGHLSMENEG